MSSGRVRILLACLVLLSVGAAPFLVRGDQQREALKQANQLEIAALSETDRARILDRNLPVFKELTDAERSTYINLHERVATDRTQGGQLASTLTTYYDWLKTLEPYQRVELEKTTSTAKRLELMNQFLREQAEHRAQSSATDPLEDFESSGRGGWRPPPMSSETLARVMQEMEQVVFHRLSAKQRSELDHVAGLARYVRLLGFIREESIASKNTRLYALKDDDELQRVLGMIEDSRVKEFFTGAEGVRRRMKWHGVLETSLWHELNQISEGESRPPELTVLREDFQGLTEKEQDQLLRLSAGDLVDELSRRNLERNATVTRDDLHAVLRLPEEFQQTYADQFIRSLDRNQNGSISLDEVPDPMRGRLGQVFRDAGTSEIPLDKMIELARRFGHPGPHPGGPGDGRPNGGPGNGGGRFDPRGGGGPNRDGDRERGRPGPPPFGPPPDEPPPPDGPPDELPTLDAAPPSEPPSPVGAAQPQPAE